jgi:signal transduction histidine kinase
MQESVLQYILDLIHEPFVAIDPEYRLIAFNQAYATKVRTSYHKEAEIGKNFNDLYHDDPKTLELVTKNWKVALDGRINEFEDEIYNIDQVKKNYKVVIAPLYNADKKISGAYCIAKEYNNDEARETELELKKNTDVLRETGRLAKIGGWELNLSDSTITWSEEVCLIYEACNNTHKSIFESINLYPEEERPLIDKAIKECIDSAKPFDLELALIPPSGICKTVRMIGKAETHDGKVTRVFGVLQDITEQYLMQNQLINNQKLMRSLFDSMNVGYCSLDTEYNFTYVNRRIQEKLSHVDFIGNNIYDLFPVLKGTDIEKFFLNIIHQKLTLTFEYLLPITDSWFEFTVSPIGDGGTGIFLKDVSVRKQMEEDIRRTNAELQSVNEYLSNQNKQLEDFAHIASHNLRSPIANLNALIELYSEATDEEERKNYVTMFSEVVNNATITLNDLIEVVQIKKIIKRDIEKLYFEDILKRTKEILSADIENSGATITYDFVDIDYIEYPKIYLDSIFQNILSNSIKYRSPHRDLIVHFKIKRNDGKTILTVEDNGLGMDMERYGDRLFGFQKTFHKNKNSKGIGLFITKNQVESMGGSIKAVSKLNAGMKIIITF